jgi:PAS domain S-box-containing protein
LETSLLGSEQLFRTTYDRAVIGIAHVSPDGHWLRFNQRLCDILGYSREELATRTFQDITHPDDWEASSLYFQRLLAGELETYEMDKRYIRKDGVPVWVHLTVSLVRTPEGAPDYTISMVQDITERKRLEEERARLLERELAARAAAEAALTQAIASEALAAERAERLRAILETMADGVGVYDQVGRIVQCNRAYRELLAVARIPGFEAIPLAERAPLLEMRDAATGKPLSLERFPVTHALRGEALTGPSADILIRALDGRELEANLSAAPLRDGAGRVVGAVSVIHDVTWRRRLERERDEALAGAIASEARATERAERLRAILETMADGVAVYDPVGRVVQSNRAYRELLAATHIPGLDALPVAERIRLLDLRDAATGKPIPAERIPGVRALRGEVVSEPSVDIRMQAFDGRELEVNASAAPLRDGVGRVVGSVSVIHDVTWRRRLEREREEARAHELALRELNQRKDEFLGVVSHEIRTPLASLQGYIQLLARRFDAWRTPADGATGVEVDARDAAQVWTALAYSEESIQRLTHLANDLVDDARIRDGRLVLRLAPCDLGSIVEQAVAEQRALEPERVIRLEPLGEPGARPARVLVIADADRIRQVVTNYLTNALKYSNEERPIVVRLEVEGDVAGDVDSEGGVELARVSVRDEGPGLPPSAQARLWERFPRIEGVVVRSGSGVSLGLGLHICKAIVEAHGGQVGVESVVGRGSTFWFTLPLIHDVTS